MCSRIAGVVSALTQIRAIIQRTTTGAFALASGAIMRPCFLAPRSSGPPSRQILQCFAHSILTSHRVRRWHLTPEHNVHTLCGHSSLWATLLLPPRHRASLTTHLNLHPWSPARGTSNHHIQIGHSIHLCRRLNGQTVRLMSIFTTDLASSPSF